MNPDKNDELFLQVSGKAFMDEAACVHDLLPEAKRFVPGAASIQKKAKHYVEAVRSRGEISHLEAFQHEYSLDSQEGIMIMCMAEALLRIPDTATADALIHDKLSSGDWDKHIGFGRPWFISMESFGLELAEKMVGGNALVQSTGEFIASLIRKVSEPVVRSALKHAMKIMGSGFVLGETIADAKKEAAAWHKKGCLFSFDMLGEGACSKAQADHYFESYLHAIKSLAAQNGRDLYQRDGISIKLSALHPRVELRQWQTLQNELLPQLKMLVREAAKQGILITVDAEESTRLDVTLLIFAALFFDPEFAGYEGLGLAVQAYQKRACAVIDYLKKLAEKSSKRIPLRLVKGAYWDSEIKRAQVDGLAGYPVFTRKVHTDISYLACAKKLLKNPQYFYPQFATHNARTIASIVELAGESEYEFQRLHGMGEALYDVVLAETSRPCRIYAPVGAPAHLLSYLIRRILENGANSSFVRGLYNAPVEELIADPIVLAESTKGSPAAHISLPESLYPDRKNSHGVDLGNAAHLQSLQNKISSWNQTSWKNPKEASATDCETAFMRAGSAFTAWKAKPISERAECLERIAALYAEHEDELIALCMQEAGKTISDAVAEMREAVDYCRYYASEARRVFAPLVFIGPSGERNTLCLHPRGTIVAISPWNFPLAIFTGQIAAALVTGNCVIAKPAEQTPKIAARATELMHAAGMPEGVLQLLCGSGEVIGQKLVGDARVAGVVFTGSTETAWSINRTLAARNVAIVPLIAETGGQNCMIVDSSALIEQTVDDIIISAFGSAGQRCSSLRVAFVQEDIADNLLQVLAGAMQQLKVGDVTDFSTDIGPVIDKEAYDKLAGHIAQMKQNAKFIAASPLSADVGLLVVPHAFEIASIDVLGGEVFGPILHVVRYKADALDDVIAQINSTGYGLTFGIQSRIDEKIRYISQRVNAGNIYVNRSMIGAVVGVQPFGGNGISGTGPKAGGPHYLARFSQEQTVSVNTAAVGGNIELLTLPNA